MRRFPSKINAFKKLRELGVEIGTVIDVGAHMDTVELRQVFPDKRQILFEPTTEFHPAIRANYEGIDYLLVERAVSNTDGEAQLQKVSIDGGQVTHSGIVDPSTSGDLTTISTVRLDTFMGGRDEPKPYLLKIDVDGHEREVIEGCKGLWDDIAIVVIEATQSTFVERVSSLAEKGFTIFDIVDICYYHDVFAQADLVMISPKVYTLDSMRPWQTKAFHWSAWIDVAAYEPQVQVDPAAGGSDPSR